MTTSVMARRDVNFGHQRVQSVDLCRMRVGPDGRHVVVSRCVGGGGGDDGGAWGGGISDG